MLRAKHSFVQYFVLSSDIHTFCALPYLVLAYPYWNCEFFVDHVLSEDKARYQFKSENLLSNNLCALFNFVPFGLSVSLFGERVILSTPDD